MSTIIYTPGKFEILAKDVIHRYQLSIRDGVKKSKWKFKMAFAMKGGGLEGVSSAIYLFWKMIFLKTI